VWHKYTGSYFIRTSVLTLLPAHKKIIVICSKLSNVYIFTDLVNLLTNPQNVMAQSFKSLCYTILHTELQRNRASGLFEASINRRNKARWESANQFTAVCLRHILYDCIHTHSSSCLHPARPWPYCYNLYRLACVLFQTPCICMISATMSGWFFLFSLPQQFDVYTVFLISALTGYLLCQLSVCSVIDSY